MSRIINKKTPKQFFIGNREILRDTRISGDAKNLYYVLSSLAESCDQVVPSHKWLATEIGYNTLNEDKSEKTERAIHKFISTKLEELESINAIVTITRQGYSNNYEIYDYPLLTPVPRSSYPPEPKGTDPLNVNVHTPLNPEVRIEIREREIRREEEEKPPHASQNSDTSLNDSNSEIVHEDSSQKLPLEDLPEIPQFKNYEKPTFESYRNGEEQKLKLDDQYILSLGYSEAVDYFNFYMDFLEEFDSKNQKNTEVVYSSSASMTQSDFIARIRARKPYTDETLTNELQEALGNTSVAISTIQEIKKKLKELNITPTRSFLAFAKRKRDFNENKLQSRNWSWWIQDYKKQLQTAH